MTKTFEKISEVPEYYIERILPCLPISIDRLPLQNIFEKRGKFAMGIGLKKLLWRLSHNRPITDNLEGLIQLSIFSVPLP